MSQENVKLPLFGEFRLKEVDHFDNNSINLSHFSSAQISLIDFFSCKDFHLKIVHLSLGLILHWYQNQRNTPFHQKFKSENDYWEIMTGILRETFSHNYEYFSAQNLLRSLEF
jgi:hypothetical protein